MVAEEKLYVADPFTKASGEACGLPSTVSETVPVAVVVLEGAAEATEIVMTSLAPGAGVVVAATSVVFEDTGQADSKLKKSIEPRPEASS